MENARRYSNERVNRLIQDQMIDAEELRKLFLFSNEFRGFSSGIEVTPGSVTELAIKYLDITSTNTVADFGCGVGSSMVTMAANGARSMTGIDLNSFAIDIAKVRFRLLKEQYPDLNLKLTKSNLFDFSTQNHNLKYDRIFSHFPWRISKEDSMENWKSELFEGGLLYPSNSEWFFMALIMSHLKDTGKAVLLAPR